MKKNPVGKTGIMVSEVSLGCWTMGGLNWVDGHANGWADVSEEEVEMAIRLALEAGVNHFDNADVYGNGRAERMLGRILKRLGVADGDVVIASKVGHFRGTSEHAYHPFHIRRQCEQTLINLRRDYLDIYYFHHGNFGKSGEWLEEAAATMDDLVREGKVRAKGQSAYSAADFQRAIPVVKPDVLQSWAHLLDDQFIRPGQPVPKLMEDFGCSFVAFSPLGQGLLLGKYSPESPPSFESGDHRANNHKFREPFLQKLSPVLEETGKRFGTSTEERSATAQRYILSHPGVCCTIPGFRNARQVQCNLAAARMSLNSADVQWLRSRFQNLG